MRQTRRALFGSQHAVGLTLILASLGVLAPPTMAATLDVASSGERLLVALDGGPPQDAPVRLDDLPAGSHTLSFRATPFGAELFTETVELEAQSALSVVVDLAARRVAIREAELPAGGEDQAPETAAASPEADSSDAVQTEVREDAPPAAAASAGDLYIAADVEGAAIILDDEDTGQKTPAMLRGVPPGAHVVLLTTECGRARGEVDVREGLIQRLELVLRQGTGALSISAAPAGALILLDGEDVGAAPKVIRDLTCGEHSLVLRAPGFLEASRVVRTPAYETTSIEESLIAETYGTLVVAPTPLQASVVVDGVPAGSGPMTIEGVGSGAHHLELAAQGFQTWSDDIEISADEVTRIDVELSPLPAGRGTRDLPWGRLALNTGISGGGLVLGVLALSDYAKARDAFEVYLDEPKDAVAEAWFEEEVRPMKRRSAAEGIGGLALLGLGTALWITTDFDVSIGPAAVGLRYRW